MVEVCGAFRVSKRSRRVFRAGGNFGVDLEDYIQWQFKPM